MTTTRLELHGVNGDLQGVLFVAVKKDVVWPMSNKERLEHLLDVNPIGNSVEANKYDFFPKSDSLGRLNVCNNASEENLFEAFSQALEILLDWRRNTKPTRHIHWLHANCNVTKTSILCLRLKNSSR